LDVLLTAWEQLGSKVPLKIVGDGPLSNLVVAASQRMPQVEWLGRLPMNSVYDLMGEAMAVIVPSKWYETFGRVAIEAFAKGTPVIAANLGAIAELVDDGRTGLHFHPNDSQDLAERVEYLWTHPKTLSEMRQQARAEFIAKYTAETNYQQFMKIYAQALLGSKTEISGLSS
jgi:glycosyltransferase involved in cell wall biosynthesis